MTAEGEKPVNRPAWENPQVRILLAVIAVAVVGVVVWLAFFNKSKKHADGHKNVKGIPATIMSGAQLKAEALKLGVGFYWAGPKPGSVYEFTRSPEDKYFVRYLPKGSAPLAKCKACLIVVTYPFIGGYYAVQQQAKTAGSTTLKGPHGSIIYVDQKRPRSVYVAFKNDPNYEVVVYHPNSVYAANAATSGNIKPVTG